MEIKTFDTILTGICDSFDALIAPKTIARTNTNVVYLIFKAISKGFEIINNVCVVLNNKFNPSKCSEEDLDSVASLVGTERLQGSGSGLRIYVTNDGDTEATLLAGTYVYALDSDTNFEFEVVTDTAIASGAYITFMAMSTEIGSYPVTEQQKITVTSSQTIPEDLVFSCQNNSSLLGKEEETDIEFRKRITSDITRQDTISELETLIKNLPYAFDCMIKFNNSYNTIVYEGITIPPFTALICYSGEIKTELADKVCSKIICPTVQTQDSTEVRYESEVFVNGYQSVYLTPFVELPYTVYLIYKIDELYADRYDTEEALKKALLIHFTSEVHSDYIREDDIYNYIETLNLTGVTILGVNLKVNNVAVDYVEVPKNKIAKLTDVSFRQE